MPNSRGREISFAQAVREGIDQAMEHDPSVLVIGEGVPDPKAIFNSTAQLRDKYGSRRVFDMPLSENGITGVCIGAALSGLRPVMVHQRIDFALLAMDQLVNNAAKWQYMFNGKASVPLVVRLIVGRGWGQGPQHSQSLQAMFAHVPGLKVVMPATARDAKGMLIAAIEDDGPVIFIEHRWLHNVVDVVPEAPYRVELNRARILREGADVTVAAFSHMAMEALLAARALEEMSIGVEVIDMRSVRPLDAKTVMDSVRKTGRLIVADTAHKTGGIAGELVSQVVERAFSFFRVAPVRVALPDYPAPTSHFMLEGYYPGPLTIADAILDLVEVKRDSVSYQSVRTKLLRRGPIDTPSIDFKGPF